MMQMALVVAMVLALGGCGLKEQVEREIEEQASQVITDAMDASGGAYMGQDLPEGYPLQDFPVYGGQESDVLGGMRQPLDDKLMFSLTIGTGHDPQIVEGHIREDYRTRSAEFEEVIGGGLFIGTIGQWRYSIVVSDGQADGYASLVSYTLEEF